MYKIVFYEDNQGKKPAREYLKALKKKKDKASRIKADKITQYLHYLRTDGTFIGQPVVKHIEGDIWELRPAKDRIFFVVYHKGVFVLLHAFTKKTAKTPEKELERARAEYRDLMERGLGKNDK
ncbi:MAG: type II toxin-antitoxin system RelE/ParE family toxin [Selenomonadaceae bacterium]|nr:type II toxin-antitoxin system RelE/ParE family toxin [Selenomonadaceae bacterium]